MPERHSRTAPSSYSSTLLRSDKQATLDMLNLSSAVSLSSRRVRALDEEGNMTTKQTGIQTFYLKQQTLFYMLRSRSWACLITVSVLAYLALVAWLTLMYYGWSEVCGVSRATSWISSLYFTVVSLAANGGYEGEDPAMFTPSHWCYYGRTFLVMLASFTNIIFVGLVAALFVGKAEYAAKFANRVIFSRFCTLTRTSPPTSAWCLNFPGANLATRRPPVQARLRLFCIIANDIGAAAAPRLKASSSMPKSLQGTLTKASEPARQSGRRERRTGAVQAAAPARPRDDTVKAIAPDEITRETVRDAGSTDLLRVRAAVRSPPRPPSPRARHAIEGLCPKVHHAIRACVCGAENASSWSTLDASVALSSDRATAARGEGGGITPIDPNAAAAFSATLATRRERTRKEAAAIARGGTHTPPPQSLDATPGKDAEGEEPHVLVTLFGESPTKEPTPRSGAAEDTSRPSSRGRHAGHSHVRKKKRPKTSKASPVSSDESCPLLLQPRVEHLASARPEPFQRVGLKMIELAWTCAEESLLGHTPGELALWYPSTIQHVVDEQSPLYPFVQTPKEGSFAFSSSRYTTLASCTGLLTVDSIPECFQIIVLYDAVEMESGALIRSSHTYTLADIIRNYQFTNELICVRNENGEVHLDYNYFNVMQPVSSEETFSMKCEGRCVCENLSSE